MEEKIYEILVEVQKDVEQINFNESGKIQKSTIKTLYNKMNVKFIIKYSVFLLINLYFSSDLLYNIQRKNIEERYKCQIIKIKINK